MKKKSKNGSLKICYVLSYRSPNYIRTEVLLSVLESIPDTQLFVARNSSKGIRRYFETVLEFLKVRFKYDPDVYIIGFRGHEIALIIRLFTLGRKIIFDEMVSPYDSLRNERKAGFIGVLVSILIYPFEWLILHSSNIILTDTPQHKHLVEGTFRVHKGKVKYIYVGALEDRRNHPKRKNDRFTVFFYGTFLPLHGVEYILDAVERLRDLPIQFQLIVGKSRAYKSFIKRLQENDLANVEHHFWVQYDELMTMANSADLTLGGPFGGTGQAGRIVTGKTNQFLSLGKPVLIGYSDVDVGFKDKENCIVAEQANPESLATQIRWAYENQDKLKDIAQQGRTLFQEKFGLKKLSVDLVDILNDLST